VKVLVILGGRSAEREVSLQSGANIIGALKEAGYSVDTFDPKLDGDINNILKKVDVVFPILHGKGGEDGKIQKVLEDFGVPFVGSSSQASANCFDKFKTQQMLSDILFPDADLVDFDSIRQSKLIFKPYVLKPLDEGSSIDLFIIKNVNNFKVDSIKNIFAKHKKMLLQEYIEGEELTVPILTDRSLPVIEIVPPEGQEFDYLNKYNGKTKELCPPQNIDNNMQKQAQSIALDIHNRMGCKSFSRVDFILSQDNKLYALEINTLPGMTKESLFPKSAKVAGIEIEALVDILVKDALGSS
jgi:D-alanine-D-alanine ligase